MEFKSAIKFCVEGSYASEIINYSQSVWHNFCYIIHFFAYTYLILSVCLGQKAFGAETLYCVLLNETEKRIVSNNYGVYSQPPNIWVPQLVSPGIFCLPLNVRSLKPRSDFPVNQQPN